MKKETIIHNSMYERDLDNRSTTYNDLIKFVSQSSSQQEIKISSYTSDLSFRPIDEELYKEIMA